MKLEEIMNSDQLMMVAIARNNPAAVRKNLEPHNSYAAKLTNKGIVESLFFLHSRSEDNAFTVVDVPWLPGANTEVDHFVLTYAGSGSTLIRAKKNFELKPHIIVSGERPQTELQDPDMDWTVIFAFAMALIVIYIWTKTSKK